MSLLTPEFQARLAQLDVVLRRALPSSRRGERKAKLKKGISLEFADFRSYVPGDDVRHLDWATYGRLDQLVLKLYHDEEDLQLHIVVDDSASMAYGSPSKQGFSREVAAALAWIGLSRSHRVSLHLLADEPRSLPPMSGAASFPSILARLEEEPGASKRPLSEGCRALREGLRPRGIVILVSDLLDPLGIRATLDRLQGPTSEVSVLQVLAPEDVDPTLDGDLRLLDMESGDDVEVTLTPKVLETYRRTARAFIAECAEVCRRRGVAFAWSRTDLEMEEFVLRSLVDGGILR